MNKLLGWMMTGGLLLGYASTSQAQITIQPGRNGSPSVTFGQPAYGPQYAPSYAQPNYGQPGYRAAVCQPGYGQPYIPAGELFVRLFARTTHPGMTDNSGLSTTPTPAIRGLIARNPGITTMGTIRNTQPYPPQGTGVIINGRSFTLPR